MRLMSSALVIHVYYPHFLEGMRQWVQQPARPKTVGCNGGRTTRIPAPHPSGGSAREPGVRSCNHAKPPSRLMRFTHSSPNPKTSAQRPPGDITRPRLPGRFGCLINSTDDARRQGDVDAFGFVRQRGNVYRSGPGVGLGSGLAIMQSPYHDSCGSHTVPQNR